MRRVRVYVSGTVQGVFYRESTRKEAERLGLRGWVRNLDDGRVELVAEGPNEALAALLSWCQRGPPNAHVKKLDVDEVSPDEELQGFVVRR